ncbi:MAG TPA: hypothetical protein PKW95_05650 [bacterium]|nr:hypothetical protein [bacterium]
MKIWRRGGKWWTCAVIVLGALQYVVPAIVLAPAYPGHMALAAGVIVSGGVLLRRRARPITIAMLSLAVCSVTLVMSYYEMYFRINEHEFVRRDETLAAVGRMVVAYEDAPEFSQMRRLAFNRPLDQLWVTRGYDRPEELPSLMRVALADGHFDIGAQTPTQAVAVDEAAQRVYVGHFRTNTLAVYDAATCQELKRVETPQRPVRLVLSPDRATLWVLNDPDAFVTRWDARTLTKVADSEMVDIQMPYPFAYSAAEKRLYLSFSMLDLHILLVELDAETLAVKRNKTIGVTPARDMLVDENAGRLYVARPLLARVEAYDLRSLEKLFSLPAPMGVYSLTTTHDGRSLFAGSFTTGELWKIDIGARKRTWRGFVGRRIRHLATHPDTGEIYGTSALGLFVIDPNKC